MSPLKLNLAMLGVIVAVASGFMFGALRPGMKELEARRAELRQTVAAMQEHQAQVGDVGALYSEIVTMEKPQRLFPKRLPAQQQIAEFLRDVSELLERCEIAEYAVEPQAPRELDERRFGPNEELVRGTIGLPVTLSFECEFGALSTFLDGLERLERVNRIRTVRAVNQPDRIGRLQVEMEILVFHRPADREAAALASGNTGVNYAHGLR